MPVFSDDVIRLRRDGAIGEFVVVRIGDDEPEAKRGTYPQEVAARVTSRNPSPPRSSSGDSCRETVTLAMRDGYHSSLAYAASCSHVSSPRFHPQPSTCEVAITARPSDAAR